MKQLGLKAKDSITGYTGIIVARSQWITGCDQYCLVPPAKDNERKEGEWFDESRLIIIGQGVLEAKKKKNGGPQYDSKNIRRN